MNDIVTYVPQDHWIWSDFLRPAAYGALAGVCINALFRWF
jgi:hypothetical protein